MGDVLNKVAQHRWGKSTARERIVLRDSDNNGKVGKAVQEVKGAGQDGARRTGSQDRS